MLHISCLNKLLIKTDEEIAEGETVQSFRDLTRAGNVTCMFNAYHVTLNHFNQRGEISFSFQSQNKNDNKIQLNKLTALIVLEFPLLRFHEVPCGP